MRHALVSPQGEIVEFRDYAPLGDQSLLHPGKPRMLPVAVEGADYDPVAEVREGPMFVVEGPQVVERYTVRPKSEAEIDGMRVEKSAAVEAEFQARATAPISYLEASWHADAEAVQNIMGVVLLIAAGVPVPDPRPWTPVGSLTPVDISHAQLVGLGAAIAARKDALFVAKKQKQAAIAAIATAAEVDAFDPAAAW